MSDDTPLDPESGAVSADHRIRAAIDATVLGAAVPDAAVDQLCRVAVREELRAVCVPPAHVDRARERCAETPVRVVTVANFPFGHGVPAAVEAEARAARAAGADEVDMVFPLHCVPDGAWERAGPVLDALEAGLHGLPYKLILETAAWDAATLDDLLAFVRKRGIATVKTSTGFHPAGGATLEAVRTLRAALPDGVSIKAAGGIRTRSFALELLDAGAAYLGTSSPLDLLEREERG